MQEQLFQQLNIIFRELDDYSEVMNHLIRDYNEFDNLRENNPHDLDIAQDFLMLQFDVYQQLNRVARENGNQGRNLAFLRQNAIAFHAEFERLLGIYNQYFAGDNRILQIEEMIADIREDLAANPPAPPEHAPEADRVRPVTAQDIKEGANSKQYRLMSYACFGVSLATGVAGATILREGIKKSGEAGAKLLLINTAEETTKRLTLETIKAGARETTKLVAEQTVRLSASVAAEEFALVAAKKAAEELSEMGVKLLVVSGASAGLGCVAKKMADESDRKLIN